MSVSKKYHQLQQAIFDLFKSQDPENGKFDIVFEVEGKKLYAYKFLLIVISSTFDSMLSDRWNKNKDEPIKIKDYSFDDFFQFLSFIYSSQCELIDKNVFVMVDIAEFYQVDLLKDYCDEYLSEMEFPIDNVLEFLDFANKHLLIKLKTSIKTFMIENFVDLGNSDNFLKAKKAIVTEIVLSVKDKVKPEDLLQFIYKWAEKQALDKQATDEKCNLNDAIRNEMSCYLHFIDFNMMELKFLNEFVVPRGFIFHSPEELNEILDVVKYSLKFM